MKIKKRIFKGKKIIQRYSLLKFNTKIVYILPNSTILQFENASFKTNVTIKRYRYIYNINENIRPISNGFKKVFEYYSVNKFNFLKI